MRICNRRSLCSAFVLSLSKLVAISLVILGLCSQPVSAANWVYLQRQEGTRYGACTEYIDADSVIKTDQTVTYWTIWVFDEQNTHHNIMKLLQKKTAALPGQTLEKRLLERYSFDAADAEIWQHVTPVKDYGNSPDEISRALGYAKAGSPSDAPRPDHVVTPTPRWYGYKMTDDADLYWDIHSIVAWPQNNPQFIDIRVKKRWTPEALERRKAFLASQHPPYLIDGDRLRYTVVNYQFLIDQPMLQVLEETDFDRDNQRVSLVDGTAWKEIEQGSIEAAIKRIALNWISDSDGCGDLHR